MHYHKKYAGFLENARTKTLHTKRYSLGIISEWNKTYLEVYNIPVCVR